MPSLLSTHFVFRRASGDSHVTFAPPSMQWLPILSAAISVIVYHSKPTPPPKKAGELPLALLLPLVRLARALGVPLLGELCACDPGPSEAINSTALAGSLVEGAYATPGLIVSMKGDPGSGADCWRSPTCSL